MSLFPFGLTVESFPIQSPALRRILLNEPHGICPECGQQVDTGWECTECGFDGRDEAYPPERRATPSPLTEKGKGNG